MHAFLEIARSGWDGLVLHPLRAFVTVLAVVVALAPFLCGLCIAEGIQAEARASLLEGGDLTVTGTAYEEPASIPLSLKEKIAKVKGVISASTRVIGRVSLGSSHLAGVLVGIPEDRMPAKAAWIDGGFPRSATRDEIVVGADLARQLHLRVGDVIPPFYHSRSGDRLSTVVGLFRPEAPLWCARIVLTTVSTAMRILDHPDFVTEIQVQCTPGAEAQVAGAILALDSPEPLSLSVTSRAETASILKQSAGQREALFDIHVLLSWMSCIWVVLITSGAGRGERVREVGVLKATGWATDEILLRSFFESLSLGLIAFCVSAILVLVWLACFNGWGIAPLFIAGLDSGSNVRLPYALTPFIAGTSMIGTVAIVLTGTLFSAWRAAIAPPSSAMRSG
jgi:ABC-type lipoprotein release transport system permease subunit